MLTSQRSLLIRERRMSLPRKLLPTRKPLLMERQLPTRRVLLT